MVAYPFPSAATEALVECSTERLRRLYPISTPKDDTSTRERDIFIGIALREAINLQKALPIDEQTYLSVTGSGYHEARAFYIYGIMDEVLKATTAMMRWREFIEAPNKAGEQALAEKEHGAHIMRVTKEALIDEQHLWVRKLTEFLCDMLLFESTNTQEYYHLFLACELLDAYLGLQRDFGEFYSCENVNAQHSIRDFLSTVNQIGRTIDLKAVWFLKPIRWDKSLSPGNLFCSTRSRYKRALLKADADQKITLGVSYEKAYSIPSRSIHANIGGPSIEIGREAIEATFFHVILLCMQILLQAHKLAGIPLAGESEFVKNMVVQSDGAAALKLISGKEMEVGDIVFAYGKDLCIITDRSKSTYGYTSYKVKYLTAPLLPEVQNDWFPARYVHLLCPQKLVRPMLLEIFKDHADATEKILNMPEPELLAYLAKTALQAFNEGMFDQLFVRRD